jgi:nucleotide-binding universal stress UspA family protein
MAAKPVIAGTDGSPSSFLAVEWAAREAVLHRTGLRVVAVPSLPPRMTPDAEGRETVAGHVRQAMREALAEATKRATTLEPGLAVEPRLLPGAPAQVLFDLAAEGSMLVVGSRGAGGFSAMVLGSVSRYLATRAACPVVVVREETMAVHREVVVGVRDAELADSVLEFACQEAMLRQARLLAVHAWTWHVPGARRAVPGVGAQQLAVSPGELAAEAGTWLEDHLARWREKYPGLLTGWEVVQAHPARVLAGASARADLVVLGRRKGGSAVGSVTHTVLTHAHGPVATVPSGRPG